MVLKHVPANGATFAVDDAGEGGPPFVFVHGFACDRSFWQPQFEDLSRDHRCITIDLRGRGDTPAVPPYHVTQQADDVAAVMQALGLGPAIIVGHSLGGIVALLLNDRHPEAVLGIVAGDTPLRPGSFGAEQIVEAIRAASSSAPIGALVENFWSASSPEELKTHVRTVMLGCPPDVAAGMIDEFSAFTDRSAELVKLADAKPFMAIWAQRPAGDVAWLRDTAMFLRQEPISGTGHFFQCEQPAITNALLRAFLDDVERDPRIRR